MPNPSKIVLNSTSLHQAICGNKVQIVERLLSKGTDSLEKKNDHGDTPLLYALKLDESKDFSICKNLLEKGADIHAINHEGHNALRIAVDRHELALVELLLNHKKSEQLLAAGFVQALKIAINSKFFGIANILVSKAGDTGCIWDLEVNDFNGFLNTVSNFKDKSASALLGALNEYKEDFGISVDADCATSHVFRL